MAYGDELKIEPFAHPDGTPDGFICNETNHATKTGAFYYGLMGFCGCGDPEAAVAITRDALNGPPRDYAPETPAPLNHDDVTALVVANPSRAAWFIMYALDAWQLTEHGGSVSGGGWLTDRGRQAIAAFIEDENDPDGDD